LAIMASTNASETPPRNDTTATRTSRRRCPETSRPSTRRIDAGFDFSANSPAPFAALVLRGRLPPRGSMRLQLGASLRRLSEAHRYSGTASEAHSTNVVESPSRTSSEGPHAAQEVWSMESARQVRRRPRGTHASAETSGSVVLPPSRPAWRSSRAHGRCLCGHGRRMVDPVRRSGLSLCSRICSSGCAVGEQLCCITISAETSRRTAACIEPSQ
jgi:hypothetical protein